MTADDPVLSSPHPESLRPTKESMAKLVAEFRRYAIYAYSNEAEAKAMEKAQAALLSAIDTILEERDSRNESYVVAEGDKKAPEFFAELREKINAPQECRECDGCGWYEGGATLMTTCHKCGGTGIAP